MASSGYRKSEPSDDEKVERTVQSVSISRRAARRSMRVNRGGRRSVTRGRRRFESAVAQFEVTERIRSTGIASLRPHGTAWRPAKLAGLILIVAAAALLALTQSSDEWFVYAEDVQVRNLSYLSGEEVFYQSGIEGWNALWLTPDGVQERVQALPYVEAADVEIRLPAQVIIDIQEMQPIALWVTKDATYWLTADGVALPAIASTEGLPQLVDALTEARAIRSDDTLAVDPDVLDSALTLMDRLPGLNDQIWYHRNFGLNFPLPDQNIWVYWGGGQDINKKLENLRAAEALLPELEDPATLIDVRFTERPYIR